MVLARRDPCWRGRNQSARRDELGPLVMRPIIDIKRRWLRRAALTATALVVLPLVFFSALSDLYAGAMRVFDYSTFGLWRYGLEAQDGAGLLIDAFMGVWNK